MPPLKLNNPLLRWKKKNSYIQYIVEYAFQWTFFLRKTFFQNVLNRCKSGNLGNGDSLGRSYSQAYFQLPFRPTVLGKLRLHPNSRFLVIENSPDFSTHIVFLFTQTNFLVFWIFQSVSLADSSITQRPTEKTESTQTQHRNGLMKINYRMIRK